MRNARSAELPLGSMLSPTPTSDDGPGPAGPAAPNQLQGKPPRGRRGFGPQRRGQRLLWATLVAGAAILGGCSMDNDGRLDGPGWSGDSGGGNGGGGQDPVPPGQLTAAEWRDLDNWAFWLDLFEPPAESQKDTPVAPPDDARQPTSVHELWLAMESDWQTCTRARYPVVVSHGGEPAVDVALELYGAGEDPLWRARTDVAGRAELFAGYVGADCAAAAALLPEVSLFVRDASGEVLWDGVPALGAEPLEVTIQTAQPAAATLDLMFLVDTTGSMGDELRYLQAEIGDVIERVRDDADEDLTVRVSVGFYRDEGDDYVVRFFDFTTNVDQALTNLSRQSSAGGGDYPEAVHTALAEAVHEQSWSASATARLLFLVLDAPPHERDDVRQQLATTVPAAAAAGIRIVPLAASGYDIVTEYVIRAWAIVTGGTFLFLTDDSGIGNPHREPTVGDYEVELLNDLLVRVIGDYVNGP